RRAGKVRTLRDFIERLLRLTELEQEFDVGQARSSWGGGLFFRSRFLWLLRRVVRLSRCGPTHRAQSKGDQSEGSKRFPMKHSHDQPFPMRRNLAGRNLLGAEDGGESIPLNNSRPSQRFGCFLV